MTLATEFDILTLASRTPCFSQHRTQKFMRHDVVSLVTESLGLSKSFLRRETLETENCEMQMPTDISSKASKFGLIRLSFRRFGVNVVLQFFHYAPY